MKIKKSVKYHDNGNTWKELWHKEGDEYHYHKEDGPAYRSFYLNGELAYEEWWVNNKEHRMDGPASAYYNKDGTILFEKYHINGEKMSKEEWEDHPIRQEYLIKEAMKEALE